MSSPTGTNEPTTVIGINFGNSYASIAVITKEGKAECIANEDGERQIAAAISFHGEELYIGNQATPQLVKNADNTIIGFRNLLGKKFSELPSSALASSLTPSAPITQHPSLPDTPCYVVQVLVPSPAPLATSRGTLTPVPALTPSSRPSTQYPTPNATPRSEPTPQTRHVTPHDAATLFLKSLHQSATDFLGKVPDGAVLTVPSWFTQSQRDAMQAAATEAGVKVLQLLEEDAAAASVLLDSANEMNQGKGADRTTLLVDWGATDLVVSLLSIRAGLVHVLSSNRTPDLGTACPGSVDEVLVKHFAKEFVKKTGEALQVCPSNTASSRAQTKLALALPHVKRSLTTATSSTNNSSSQSKSTQISIESLQGGLDFSASLNRTRASGLLSGVFARFVDVVRTVLNNTSSEGESWTDRGIWVDSIVWVGGGGRMAAAGASSALLGSGVLGEDLYDEDIGAPEEALARGCALHGRGIDGTQYSSLDVDHRNVSVTRRTVGIIIPEPPPAAPIANGDAKHAGDAESNTEDLGGQWIAVISAETPLPARRTVRFPISASLSSSVDRVVFEIWEVSEIVRVHRTAQPQLSDASDDDEPLEDIEERERSIRKEQYLGVLELQISPTQPVKKSKEATGAVVEVRFDMDIHGGLEVRARQKETDWVMMSVGSAAT